MILARFAPVDSKRYKSLSRKTKKLEKVFEWLPMQLFGIWTTFVVGISVGKAIEDRYYFWDWSSWLIGTLGIILIAIVLNILKKRFKEFPFRSGDYSFKIRGYNAFIPLVLLSIGYITASGFSSIFDILLYLFPYAALFIVHTILVEPDSNTITKESNKHIKSITSIILLLIAIIIGSINDDPLLATASMVSLPFIVVLLFGNHIRHLERAKFYPIFVFVMFVCSREAWFIIPIFLLFHFLRSYNYLINQKIYPTFGVSDDSDR